MNLYLFTYFSFKEKRKIQNCDHNISVFYGVKHDIDSVLNDETVGERNKTMVVKKMCC